MTTAPSWGPWFLDRETLVLRNTDEDYEVDLEECATSSQLLDWIVQVADKSSASDASIAGLIRALIDVLDPQSNLCPFGKGQRVSKSLLLTLVKDARPSTGEP
jgi:hypothetical protein